MSYYDVPNQASDSGPDQMTWGSRAKLPPVDPRKADVCCRCYDTASYDDYHDGLRYHYRYACESCKRPLCDQCYAFFGQICDEATCQPAIDWPLLQ